MLLEVHGLVENANHIDPILDDAIEHKMRSDPKFPVAGPNIVAGPAEPRIVGQHCQGSLNSPEVDFRLVNAPGRGGVVPNFFDIALGAWPQHIPRHGLGAAVPRLRARNASKSKGAASPLCSPSMSAARNAASLVS